MDQKKKKVILLVEDEAIITITNKKSLERYGYSVITANSGEKAIEITRNDKSIDLILMDINLEGGMDGTVAASRILEERSIPLVFLSSHTEPEIVEKTEKITSYGYVVKSSGITVLDASIKMAFKLFNANKKIIESEDRQQAMISNITDVISIVGADGTVKYGSPNIEKLFGWKQEDLDGTSAWRILHPDDLQRITKDYEALLGNDNMSKTVECRYLCKDGSFKWIELTGTNCINDPLINGILLNYHDITERIGAQAALKESEKKLKEAQRIAGMGNWELDIQRKRFTWSDEVSGILEINTDECASYYDAFIQRIHPDDLEKTISLFKASLKSHSPVKTTHRLLMEDGRVKHVLEHCETYFDSSGRPCRSIGTIQDITSQKVAAEEKEKMSLMFQQAQKMESLGTLAAGIAHDFNNILAAIIGFADLAIFRIKKGKIDETTSDILGIKKAGLRAKEIVKQILTFSRHTVISREPRDIIPLIKESVLLLRASLPANIEIDYNIPDSDFIVKSDPTQIHQIIMNLCSNSAYAMDKEGGILSISLEECGSDEIHSIKQYCTTDTRYLRMTITDTGCGIPGEIIPKIFDPFFTTKERDRGTGMGLSVVHGIITDMEGTIAVFSEPGRGTSFHIILPITDEKPAADNRSTQSAVEGNGRILLVDDEEMINTAGYGILTQLGYNVTTADCGDRAIEIFSASPEDFDCVLTDIYMPGISGIDLAKKLKDIRHDIPVILSTGLYQKITHEDIKNANIAELVMKPMMASELSQAIRRAIKIH